MSFLLPADKDSNVLPEAVTWPETLHAAPLWYHYACCLPVAVNDCWSGNRYIMPVYSIPHLLSVQVVNVIIITIIKVIFSKKLLPWTSVTFQLCLSFFISFRMILNCLWNTQRAVWVMMCYVEIVIIVMIVIITKSCIALKICTLAFGALYKLNLLALHVMLKDIIKIKLKVLIAH